MSESSHHKHIGFVGDNSNKGGKGTKISEGENFSTNQKHLQQLQLLQRFQLKCYYHDTNMNT